MEKRKEVAELHSDMPQVTLHFTRLSVANSPTLAPIPWQRSGQRRGDRYQGHRASTLLMEISWKARATTSGRHQQHRLSKGREVGMRFK